MNAWYDIVNTSNLERLTEALQLQEPAWAPPRPSQGSLCQNDRVIPTISPQGKVHGMCGHVRCSLCEDARPPPKPKGLTALLSRLNRKGKGEETGK
jgi:hypothetical protein